MTASEERDDGDGGNAASVLLGAVIVIILGVLVWNMMPSPGYLHYHRPSCRHYEMDELEEFDGAKEEADKKKKAQVVSTGPRGPPHSPGPSAAAKPAARGVGSLTAKAPLSESSQNTINRAVTDILRKRPVTGKPAAKRRAAPPPTTLVRENFTLDELNRRKRDNNTVGLVRTVPI
jgi:hypothetical protein